MAARTGATNTGKIQSNDGQNLKCLKKKDNIKVDTPLNKDVSYKILYHEFGN